MWIPCITSKAPGLSFIPISLGQDAENGGTRGNDNASPGGAEGRIE